MTMERTEALRLLARDRRTVPEAEEYKAGYFEPSDGPGVARLFYAVYGDGYPIDTYYIPERLAEENRRGYHPQRGHAHHFRRRGLSRRPLSQLPAQPEPL